MQLKAKDFEAVIKEKLSPRLREKIDSLKLNYQLMSKKEKQMWRKIIKKELEGEKIVPAGRTRLSDWEKGWQENLNEGSIIPHYFGKYPVIRFDQNLIKPLRKNFEYLSLAIITNWLFEKYFKKTETVYEFGCGTGHNLLRLREVNRQAELWGLDWAANSQKILKRMGLKSINFDLFKPNKQFVLRKNAGVFTVAALEQLGRRFKPIVQYWLDNQIKLCMNIEPINELLDKSNFWDKLSIKYAKKRNYLDGYLTYLRQLEKQEKIVIHQAQRSYIGSLFLDGYSVIVWSARI
ncbi:MAG: class I SAM-dependent methyltransferase [Candidatus Beckwithbacteria bacterium]